MTVGERITAKMEELGLNQTQLAKRMHVSRTTVGNWITDRHPPKNKHVPRLAGILGLDPSALSPFGGDTVAPTDKTAKRTYVVLLSWSDLIHLGVGGKMKMSALRRPGYIEADIDISPECKALKIADNSMEAAENGNKRSDSFWKGDLIILDPHTVPTDGDYVLVRLRQTNEHLFRLYVQRSKSAYDLVAGNPDYPTVTINAKFPADMLGVLVEHRKKRRRRHIP